MRWTGAGLLGALVLASLPFAWPARAQPLAVQSAGATAWTVPDDAEIRRIPIDRIDFQRQGVGIVVGVIDAHGRRIVAYGAYDKGDPRRLDGDKLSQAGRPSPILAAG